MSKRLELMAQFPTHCPTREKQPPLPHNDRYTIVWSNPQAIDWGDIVICPDGVTRTVQRVGRKRLRCEGGVDCLLLDAQLVERRTPAPERTYFLFTVNTIAIRVNVWASPQGEEYLKVEYATTKRYDCIHIHQSTISEDFERDLRHCVSMAIAPHLSHSAFPVEQLSLFDSCTT